MKLNFYISGHFPRPDFWWGMRNIKCILKFSILSEGWAGQEEDPGAAAGLPHHWPLRHRLLDLLHSPTRGGTRYSNYHQDRLILEKWIEGHNFLSCHNSTFTDHFEVYRNCIIKNFFSWIRIVFLQWLCWMLWSGEPVVERFVSRLERDPV